MLLKLFTLWLYPLYMGKILKHPPKNSLRNILNIYLCQEHSYNTLNIITHRCTQSHNSFHKSTEFIFKQARSFHKNVKRIPFQTKNLYFKIWKGLPLKWMKVFPLKHSSAFPSQLLKCIYLCQRQMKDEKITFFEWFILLKGRFRNQAVIMNFCLIHLKISIQWGLLTNKIFILFFETYYVP